MYITRTASGGWSDGVTIRDSTLQLNGRNGVSIIAGSRVRIMNDVFDQIGMHAIDLEPNMGVEGASDVVVSGNHFRSYGLDADWDSWLLAACGPDTGAVIKDVTVTGNTVEGNIQGWSGKMKALNLRICGDRGPRSGFTVTDNVAGSTVAGPAMIFTQVAGVTVRGNTQPLSTGTLATFPGSTGVTYDG